MVKRRRKRRQDNWPKAKPKHYSKSPKKKSLKERFLTFSIWGLGLINITLIASILSEFFVSPTEPPLTPNVFDKKVITVEVLNACGVQGLANDISQYLRNHNFDVVNIGNYKNFDVERTLLLDRVSYSRKYAKKVAKELGVADTQVVEQRDKSLELDVTVIVGRDYKTLKVYEAIR
jgi:hypothetical protein